MISNYPVASTYQVDEQPLLQQNPGHRAAHGDSLRHRSCAHNSGIVPYKNYRTDKVRVCGSRQTRLSGPGLGEEYPKIHSNYSSHTERERPADKFSYTDNKSADECSWEPQLVTVGHQATTNNGSCIAGKCELQ